MTDTRHEIEKSPYKLRSVGNTYQVELLDGTVIGWVGRHRRMVGRQVRWEYNARDADRVLLGMRSDTDDAIELVYSTWLLARGEDTVAELTRMEQVRKAAELMARLYLIGDFDRLTNAQHGLHLWGEMFGVELTWAEVEAALIEAKRRVEER